MTTKNRAAQASALALGLMLAACGGGGGVASTPTPTPPSYTKLADITGDRTFQTGGINFQITGGLPFAAHGTDKFGSGVTVAYAAASGNYTVTPPGGTAVTFTPAENDPSVANATTQGFIKNLPGGGVQTLLLTVPTNRGVALSYLVFGQFVDAPPSGTKVWIAVGGVPTVASDMPKTGTATYAAETGANILTNTGQYVANTTNNTNSTATFLADFAAGTVSTAMHLIGANVADGAIQDFGTFNGTGTITSGGPGFSGTFANTTAGGFSGGFFGPQALEMGYAFNFVSGGSEFIGGTSGKKQ